MFINSFYSLSFLLLSSFWEKKELFHVSIIFNSTNSCFIQAGFFHTNISSIFHYDFLSLFYSLSSLFFLRKNNWLMLWWLRMKQTELSNYLAITKLDKKIVNFNNFGIFKQFFSLDYSRNKLWNGYRIIKEFSNNKNRQSDHEIN